MTINVFYKSKSRITSGRKSNRHENVKKRNQSNLAWIRNRNPQRTEEPSLRTKISRGLYNQKQHLYYYVAVLVWFNEKNQGKNERGTSFLLYGSSHSRIPPNLRKINCTQGSQTCEYSHHGKRLMQDCWFRICNQKLRTFQTKQI